MLGNVPSRAHRVFKVQNIDKHVIYVADTLCRPACTAGNSATHSAQAPGLQAAAVAAAPAAGSELLLNPSFETGSNSVSDNGGKITGFLPDGWADNTGVPSQ